MAMGVETWSAYWAAHAGAEPWDAEPDVGVAKAWPRLRWLIDPLPMIDVGGGAGGHGTWLADKVERVLTLDVAGPALGASGGETRQLDVLDAAAVAALHGELGDANVYCRVLFSTLGPADRTRLADNLALLIGTSGVLYCVEPAPAAEPLLSERAGPAVAALLGAGVKVAGLERAQFHSLFPGDRFRLFGEGYTQVGALPGYWVMLRRGREGDDFAHSADGLGSTDRVAEEPT